MPARLHTRLFAGMTTAMLAALVSACGLAPVGSSGGVDSDLGFDGLIYLSISSGAPTEPFEGGIELFTVDPADGDVENIHAVSSNAHGIFAPSINPVLGSTPAHILRSRFSPNFDRYVSIQGEVALIIDMVGRTSEIATGPPGVCENFSRILPRDAVFAPSGDLAVLHETCDGRYVILGETGRPTELPGREQAERQAASLTSRSRSTGGLVVWPATELVQLGQEGLFPSPTGRYAALTLDPSGAAIVTSDGAVVANTDRTVLTWVDDERFIAAAGDGYEIVRIDSSSGSVASVGPVPNSVVVDSGSVVISPDREWMAVDGEGTVAIIELATGERRTFEKPPGRIVDWII